MIRRDARITNLSRLLNNYCADKPEVFQTIGCNNPTASTMHYTLDVVYDKLKKLNYPYIDPTRYNSYFDVAKILEAVDYSSDSNVFSDEDARKIYNYIMDEMSTILDNQFNGYLTVYNSIIDDVVTYLKDHDSSIKNVTLYKKGLCCNDEIGKGRIDPNLMSIKVWYRSVDILYKLQCADDIHHIDYIYKDTTEYLSYDCSVNGVIFKKYNDIKHTILQSCMRYTMCHCMHSMDDLRAAIDKLNHQSYLDGLIKIYLYDGLVVDCFYEVEYNDDVTNTYYVFAMPLPASSSSDIERTDGRICVFDVDTPICIANQFIRFSSVGFMQDANVTGKLNGYSSMIDKMYASFKDTNILDDAIDDVSIKEYKDICKLYLGRYKHVTKIEKCLSYIVDFEGASSIMTCSIMRLVLWLSFMRHAIIPIRHIYEENHNKDIFDVINNTINITLVDYIKALEIFDGVDNEFVNKFDIVVTSYIGYADDHIAREFYSSIYGINDKEIEASVKTKIVDLYDQLYVVGREDKNLEYISANDADGFISIIANVYHYGHDNDRYGTIFDYLAPSKIKVTMCHKNPDSKAVQSDTDRMRKMIDYIFNKQQFINKYIQDLERMISIILYQILLNEFTQIMMDNVYRAIIGNIRRFIKRFTEIAKDEYPDVFNKRHRNFRELLTELTYYLSFDSKLITDVHRLKKLDKIALVGSK